MDRLERFMTLQRSVSTPTERIELVAIGLDRPSYAATARIREGTGIVDVSVVEISGFDIDETKALFLRVGADGHCGVTDTLWEADRAMKGTIIGCFNWDAGSSVSGCMLHNCDGDDLAPFLRAIQRAYDMGRELQKERDETDWSAS